MKRATIDRPSAAKHNFPNIALVSPLERNISEIYRQLSLIKDADKEDGRSELNRMNNARRWRCRTLMRAPSIIPFDATLINHLLKYQVSPLRANASIVRQWYNGGLDQGQNRILSLSKINKCKKNYKYSCKDQFQTRNCLIENSALVSSSKFSEAKSLCASHSYIASM